MNRRLVNLLLVPAVVLAAASVSHGFSSYATSFKNRYPSSPLSSLSTQSGVPGNLCTLCHGPSSTPLNSYGDDWMSNGDSYPAVENMDSDGDGFTNLAEITAGTFPGNASSKPSSGDTTLPTVTAFSIPATAASLTVPITTFTATDNVGATGYMLTTSATKPAAAATGWSATPPASYAFTTAGTKTLYAWAKDAAGNVSNSLNDSVTITLPDTTAPTVTAFAIPTTATSLTVAISTFTASDSVGVTGYMVTESATKPLATAAGWGATAPTSFTFASPGAKTLYTWAKDAAGNVSNSLSDTVTITLPDTAAPTVTAFVIPTTATSLAVSVTTFTATDNVGVTGYMVTESATKPTAAAAGWSASAPAAYTATSAGMKTLFGWAKDAAGNISNSLSANVTITLPDTATPTVTAFSVPATATTLAVSITSLVATDNVGVTGYLVTESATKPAATATGWIATAPTSHTFTSAGAKTLYAWAKDAAGNVSNNLSANVTITLPDSIAPMVTAFNVPATATTLAVAISTFTATDNIGVTGYLVTESATKPAATAAGWSATAPTSHTFTSAGAKTLYAWAKDAAGNVSNSLSAAVTITLADTLAPTVTAFSVPATATTLAVSITSLVATDNVGVTGYMVTESATKPAATATSWSATATKSYTFASAGAKTLYAWAKDAAGNVSNSLSASVTITLPTADTIAPTITAFTVPATAATLSVTISAFTATDNVGVTGYLVTESATKPAATAAGWSAAAPKSYTFASAGAKALYAWAKDAAGNVSAARIANVTITLPSGDLTRPTVVSVNPARWARYVPVSTVISVTFSEPVLPGSVNASTIQVTTASGDDDDDHDDHDDHEPVAVRGTVVCKGNVVTFTPSRTLARRTAYTVTVRGVKDLSGNTMRSSYRWTFSTGRSFENDHDD